MKANIFLWILGKVCTRFLEVNCPSESSFQLLTNTNRECFFLSRDYVGKNQLSAIDSEGHVTHLQKRTRFFRTIGFLWIFDGFFLKTKNFAKGVQAPLGVKCSLLDNLFLVRTSIYH